MLTTSNSLHRDVYLQSMGFVIIGFFLSTYL